MMLGNWCAFTNHPLVQIFYAMVAGGGFSYYVIYGLAVYIDGVILSHYHWYTGLATGAFAFWSYYKACSTSPG